MKFYLILSMLILLDIATALSARMSFNTGNGLYTIVAIVSICFAGYLFMKLLKYKMTAILNIIWIGCGTFFITIAGYLLFDEKISPAQGIGMTLILIGLIIIEIYAEENSKKPVSIKESN